MSETVLIAQYPTAEQIRHLLEGPADQPVVMVNLLRFQERADGDGAEASGREEYLRYGERMREFVQAKGGRLIWAGRVDSQVIGAGAEGFHVVALMEYPSRQAFLEIVNDPHVCEISSHRAAGLEGQWLLATTMTAR
jgi:uncharacterized protein (DUF1330 family)